MRAAALLAVPLCACAASAARATTFRVVDDRGVAQLAQATVADVGLSTATNEAGEVDPASEPGDTVTITRSDQDGPCGAPEGPVGPAIAPRCSSRASARSASHGWAISGSRSCPGRAGACWEHAAG